MQDGPKIVYQFLLGPFHSHRYVALKAPPHDVVAELGDSASFLRDGVAAAARNVLGLCVLY